MAKKRERSTEMDGKARVIFERSARSQAFHEVVDEHRDSEGYARWVARKIVANLRSIHSGEEYAMAPYVADQGLLEAMVLAYKVKQEHVAFCMEIVRHVVDAQIHPREYQKRQPRTIGCKECGVRFGKHAKVKADGTACSRYREPVAPSPTGRVWMSLADQRGKQKPVVVVAKVPGVAELIAGVLKGQ